MTTSLRLGQLLQGQTGRYTIARQLQDTVWLATRTQSNEPVVVKSVYHFRLQNERDVLKRFQSRTPFIRPLLDEIADPPAIVLKHLDDHLLNASISKRLTSQEIRYVARGILEALKVLHKDRFIHTDIQIADCGSTVHWDSTYANDCDLIGAPIWRSPEAQLRIRWDTSTDIWSFGALLITLLYGDNFFLFKPNVPATHAEYELKILQRQCEFFGPFPLTYREICPREKLNILAYIMQSIPPENKKPFSRITEREVSKEDKEFILKIMKLDPRERPSAAELLRDKWFDN
ncbi:hypothetical protein DTO271D3_1202 [Paecilomyces variotii]|nr:hypothetical protein DTO271D3_1202 [Paecilomyces variotii]